MMIVLAVAGAPLGAADATQAVAVLHPTQGNKVEGTLRFEKAGNAVKVTGRITGLAPGMHGFHVHQYGDCSAPDATSAGDHFNPTAQPHGAPGAEARHLGDLGNIEAAADGSVPVDVTDPRLTLEGPNAIVGRAVIVHANPDDLKTQPSGNAGARLACGVVGVAGPPKK
jgi:Cu-Zn family superoxide dismutase